MQTYRLNISEGRDRVQEIRGELLAFSDILEVFVTGGPDALIVVCGSRPRPAEWLRALRAGGYEVSARPWVRARATHEIGLAVSLGRARRR